MLDGDWSSDVCSSDLALFTLLVLPPPYIVPIFMPAERRADQDYANNVLSLYTVASLVAFLVYVSLTA
jgi:hypothetical protein